MSRTPRLPAYLDVWLCNIPFRNCTDPRPWVVVEANPPHYKVVPLSASDLRTSWDFPIEMSHPNFRVTGLARDSFAILELQDVGQADFMKWKGRLEGQLAIEFEKWMDS
ncbi:MAG: hypothetical protein AMXMBFR7_25680 [Planctomycetota bacterium]